MTNNKSEGINFSPSHVAIIGCGFAGTSAFFQLIDRFPVKKISVFEATGDFGPGYAYKTQECQDYLINNTTDTMCMAPSNRQAFLNWLKKQPEFGSNIDPKGHLPRALYGHFLKDVFSSSRAQAADKGIEVELVPCEVTKMQETDDGRVHISWEGGQTIVDSAIMTTGRCPGIDPYPHPPKTSKALYIPDHVLNDKLDTVSLDASIHVLGASLSAYDVINRLFSPDTGCQFVRNANGELDYNPGPNNRKLALISRSGRMKNMQSQNPIHIKRKYFSLGALTDLAGKGQLTLEQAANSIRMEAKDHQTELDWETMRNPYSNCSSQIELNDRAAALLREAVTKAKGDTNFLVDLFQDAQDELWDAFADQLLDLENEQLYRTNYETATLSYVAACPVPTAEKLLALIRAGRVSIIKGVRDVKLTEDGEHYEIIHQFGIEKANVLINTTGSVDRNIDSDNQTSVIKNLRKEGLLSCYERSGQKMQGADVDIKSFRLNGAKNIYMANMFLWGPGFFTSSALLMATIVEQILESLFDT